MSLSSAAQILAALGPGCRDAERRGLLEKQTVLNGVDFVEFEIKAGAFLLHVHFIHPLPAGAYGLIADPSPIHIHGGTRIVGVTVKKAVAASGPEILDVEVDQQGDYSPYLLTIGWTRADDGLWTYAFAALDRLFSVAPINFRPGCPIDFDCAPVEHCPPDTLDEPALDYLAKDYASFRQMLLDYAARRNRAWGESSAADLGMALLELFAHEGDHLSYFQDAVANEAFLDTARQRVSAKRHAKLVDYDMHDGRNAWTFVHLHVTTPGTVDERTPLLTTITSAMRFDRVPGVPPVPQPAVPPGALLHEIFDNDYRTDPALAQVQVFETSAAVALHPDNNELRLHTWGNERCCLARGTMTAHVYATNGLTAVRPPLKPGDYLLLEELLGPTTGSAADADPTHRQVVRIERVNPDPSTSTSGPASDAMHDPLFLAALDAALEPKPVTAPVPINQLLPLVEVTWRAADALTVPICLSAIIGTTAVRRVSVARGNIALADHGRSFDYKPYTEPNYEPPDGVHPFTLRLPQGPLTFQCEPNGASGFPPLRNAVELTCDLRLARPAVRLRPVGSTAPWMPVPNLLSSTEFDRHFVVDVDDDLRGVLRFGDGEAGERFINIPQFDVWYRVGNGRPGMIGADALTHLVLPNVIPLTWPAIDHLRNPLPALGAADPETIEQVRQYAPAAFRARQFRAVTERDYRDAAMTIAGVAGAVAGFRWTGSWYTVFVGIDPENPGHVLTDARGVTRLEPVFKQRVLDGLTRYRLAGYDLEIRSARYVPLDIAIEVCVKRGFFRGDVAHAVSLELGAVRGPHDAAAFFNPANFTFAQPVYLSRIYAAVAGVEGVESARVSTFHRHGRLPAGELESGVLPIAPWEIARLDNSRSNMENGTLTITAGGGS